MEIISHREIIDREGGPAAVARRIGLDPNTTKAWKRLDSIPGIHWHALSEAGVATLAELSRAVAARSNASVEQAA